MKQELNLKILGVALFALLFLSQCSEDSPLWSPDVPLLEATVIHGLVTGPNGVPLEGVEITTPYEKAVTDELGLFHIAQGIAIKGRVSVQAAKEGYFSTAYATQTGGENTVIKFALSPKVVTNIDAATAGSVDIGGGSAQVELPANGFVDANGNAYNGTVKVATAHSNPNDPLFRRQMPAGADMAAITTDGEEAVLLSYGAVAVELTDAMGNELQLAPGSTAEISMKVPTNILVDAPATIPLWYFDETTGKWLEEGFATLVGNEYVGEVSHFSWWNCDDPIDPRAFVTGRVLDCNGNPVSGITVNVGPVTVVTNFDGYYSTNVAVGLEFEVWVDQIFNFGLQSNVIYVPSIAIGENLMLEDLMVSCPATISGILTDCEGNPSSGAVTAAWDGGSNLVNVANDGGFEILVSGNMAIEVTGILIDVLTGTQNITSVANQTVGLPTPLEVSCSSNIVGTFAACGGGPVNGTIYATWDGGETSIATLGGGFSILVPGSTEVDLQFISDDFFTTSTTITTNATGITNLPSILEACDELDCGFIDYDYNGQSEFFAGTIAEVYHEGETISLPPTPLAFTQTTVPSGYVIIVLSDEIRWFGITVPDAVGTHTVSSFSSTLGQGATFIYYDDGTDEAYVADPGSITLTIAENSGVYQGSLDVLNDMVNPLLPTLGFTPMPSGSITGTFCVEDN